jgi:hypothetical protein
MSPKNLFNEFEKGFAARKFTAGLLVAMIDMLTALEVPGKGYTSFENFLAVFPRQTQNAAGKRLNTLVVAKPDGKTLSLRKFYDDAERFYRAENKRFDYPSAAPHATQAWPDYTGWLDSLVTYSPAQLAMVRKSVNDFVLTNLKSQEFDPASIQTEPPLFRLLLDNFDITARKGEPTGAAYQGIVFGFLRADNPHLQIEIEKVRTGSKRLQRVGDVDGWEGARLAISAEVKQFEVTDGNISDFEGFANATGKRGALGVVAATAFQDGVKLKLETMGLLTLDIEQMLSIVELWDPVKQRIAVQSLIYYTKHVEKNSSLAGRLDEFIATASADWISARTLMPKAST